MITSFPDLSDDIEIIGLVGAHPVVVSPQSVAGNHPLHRIGFQQPRQKDYGGFTKNDAHHIQAQISSFCDKSLESHRLVELEVTIGGVTTTCLIDSSLTHNYMDRKTLDKLGLRATKGETLEIVLADGSKIIVDKVFYISIQFCKEIKQAVLCHVVDTLSSSFILGMQWLISTNPTILWIYHEVDLQYGQFITKLQGQAQKKQLPIVKLCSAKADIRAIRRGEQVWFMMLCIPGAACPHGLDSIQGYGMVVHDQSNNPALEL